MNRNRKSHRQHDLLVWTAALTSVVIIGSTANAQLIPVYVEGSGVADFIPFVPVADDPNSPYNSAFHDSSGHFLDAPGGSEVLVGEYTGGGRVRLDMFTSPSTAAFSSEVPYVFTSVASGDALAFHYGNTAFGASSPGEVTLSPPDNDGKVVATFVAEFVPFPAASTGPFTQVTGGSFLMVAETEPFVFGSTDNVSYSWVGDGTLSMIPEPSTLWLVAFGGVLALGTTRRKKRVF